MSRQGFNDYWIGQSMAPAAMAGKLGVTFSVDAVTGREYAEMPTANYFGKLATKDQKGLASNVIDPASKLTLGQYQALQQWAASGGPAKLQAQLMQNSPETSSTPEDAGAATSNTLATGNASVSNSPASTIETNSSGTQDLQRFVVTHAAEEGMTPEAFVEKYRDVLHGQEGKEFSPGQFYADALAKRLVDDPTGAEEEYSRLKGTDGGRILSADDARELSEHYKRDKAIAPYLQGAVTRAGFCTYRDPAEAFTGG